MKLLEVKKRFIKEFIIENIDDLSENKIDELLKAFFEINNNYQIIPYYQTFTEIENNKPYYNYRDRIYCDNTENNFMYGLTSD